MGSLKKGWLVVVDQLVFGHSSLRLDHKLYPPWHGPHEFLAELVSGPGLPQAPDLSPQHGQVRQVAVPELGLHAIPHVLNGVEIWGIARPVND